MFLCMTCLTVICVLAWMGSALALSISAAHRGLSRATYFGIGCALGPGLSLALVYTVPSSESATLSA